MLLQDLCERIYFDYNNNNKRVPHGTFKMIIDEYKDDFPTLNIAMLKVSFGRFKKKNKRLYLLQSLNQIWRQYMIPYLI